ncbi:MAG TPA: hypothetical protein VGH16_11740 [Candidatus Binatia bacterium]|jgi:hypothetical protein
MKRRCIFGVIVFIGVFLAAGCAPPIYVPFKVENTPQTLDTRVYVSISQDEINAFVEPSNLSVGAGGGLLVALIDAGVNSYRTSRANRLIEPVRKEVGDIDFRGVFLASLEKTLRALPTIQMTKIDSTAKAVSDKDRDNLRKELPETGLLSISTKYELGADFQSFYITTVVSLWLRDAKEATYLARYHYYTPPILPSDDREAAANAWAIDHGAPVRAALQEGIAETMKMMRLDFRPSPEVLVAPDSIPKFAAGSILTKASPSDLTFLAMDGKHYIVRYRGILWSASVDERFTATDMRQ